MMQTMKLLHAMQTYFPAEILALIQHAGEMATDLGLKVFLIGGSIRDLLLPQREFDWDIDLVVENEGAERLGFELHRHYGGQFQTFPQYGTVKLQITPGLSLDIATARTETYPYPGANPQVCFSDLHADLERRDFTVNAMAIALEPDKFGQLIDYFNGYYDLQHRLLRTLHANKFREDPVRSWRACRLEYALNFRIETETEAYISTTMESGLFDGFYTPRIRAELRKILSFKDPLPVLLRLEELSILRCLDPDLSLNETLLTVLNQLEQWHSWFATAQDAWLAPLFLLLASLPPVKRGLLIKKLELNQYQHRAWETFIYLSEEYRHTNWSALRRSEIYERLEKLPHLTLWLWLARFPDTPLAIAIELFWCELRTLKPRISGHDLKQWLKPGPQMRRVLRELHRLRLDGEINTYQEEQIFAQRLSQKYEVL